MKVLMRSYSTYFDVVSGTQFGPVLDRGTGCFLGMADVTEAQAKAFEGRPAFEILTDEEFLASTTTPAEPEPTEPKSGDPMTDATAAANAEKDKQSGGASGSPLAGPPPPPASK